MSFLHRIFGRRAKSAPKAAKPITVKPRLESLEQRDVPATVFAVTVPTMGVQALVRFDSATPGTVVNVGNITGIGAGESVVGIDFRPSNGSLYAVTNNAGTGRLYVINKTTGAATRVNPAGTFTLTGTSFGIDFNPVPDLLRIVSDADQNIRVNPNNGLLSTADTALAYNAGDPNNAANPNVVGSGYTNSMVGATQTTLYGIDSNLDILAIQGAPNPNGGALLTVGALGFNTTDQVALDIVAPSTAFASLSAPAATQSTFATINLNTGAATTVGLIGTASTGLIAAMSVDPNPTSTASTPPPTSNAAAVNALIISQVVFRGNSRFYVGDVNGDGTADILLTPGRGLGQVVLTFDGLTGNVIGAFQPYGTQYKGAMTLALAEINGDGMADIITVSDGTQKNDPRVFNFVGLRYV